MSNPNLGRQFEHVSMEEVGRMGSDDFFPHDMHEIPAMSRDLQLGDKRYDEGGFADLRESVREHGVQKPLRVVDYPNGKSMVKDGHHRYLAAHEVGLSHVPIERTPHEEYKRNGYKFKDEL